MKNLLGAALIILASAGVGLASAQTPTTAKSSSASQAVKQVEEDWTDAQKAGDTDRISQIVADDWTGIGYDGRKETKKGLLEAMKSGKDKMESIDLGPMNVKVLGNVAVVQGSDTEKSMSDGKDTSGKWVWMDVFVKRDGKWVAVRSQSAMVK